MFKNIKLFPLLSNTENSNIIKMLMAVVWGGRVILGCGLSEGVGGGPPSTPMPGYGYDPLNMGEL